MFASTQKTPPASAVKRKLDEIVERIKLDEGLNKVGRARKKEIKEDIEQDIYFRMPATSKTIYCLYHAEQNTTNKQFQQRQCRPGYVFITRSAGQH